MFLQVKRWHLRGAWARMYKFNMAAQFQGCRDFAKHNDCSVSLWSAERLLILTTNTEERYIAKATNSQYFTKSFTQKNVLLFALILTYGSIRFDSRNTYRVTGVTGYGFNWEPCLCWLTHKRNDYHSPCEGSTCWQCRYIMCNTVLHPGYFSCTDLGKSCQRWSC